MANSSPPSRPTESTPLSSTANLQQNYQSTENLASEHSERPLRTSEDDRTSSSDSGGGYVSGSGRRESAFGKSPRRIGGSRISPSARLGSGESTPRVSSLPRSQARSSAQLAAGQSALSWAFSQSVSRRRRDDSPAEEGVSPRMRATLAPPLPDGGSQRRDGSSQRRKGSGNGKISPAAASPAGRKGGRSRTGTEAEGDEPGEAEDSWGWFKHLIDKYGAVELDNKGSVARDHLALERTFLAWLRTSLAFASIGIAITQLFRLNSTLKPDDPSSPADGHFLRLRQVGKPLGATFLGVSIVILLIGFRRYFESQYWIIRGKFPASRGSVFLVTGVAAGLIVVSLVVVVIVGRVQK